MLSKNMNLNKPNSPDLNFPKLLMSLTKRRFVSGLCTGALFLLTLNSCAGGISEENNQTFDADTSEFYDSAHHWYDINDEDKTITPAPDQKKYTASETDKIADNILLYQKSNGGWAKNYDMQAVLTDEQKDAVLKARNKLNTTFDNGATHSQLNYLAKTYFNTKKEKYRDAFIKGIEFVLSAQYKNGGWPQYYPDTSGYRKYITFNDEAMIGIMKLLKKISDDQDKFSFLGSDILKKVRAAYDKGIDCILKCQINENGKLTAWCQQHDNNDLSPRNARSFEPAAICNGESTGIVKFLMSIDNPDPGITRSVKAAVEWFEDSRIYGIRIDSIKTTREEFMYHTADFDKVVVEDKNAKPIWTRFYQLESHKPMFCNRDGKTVYSLAEVERERRTGYAWYVYNPQTVLDSYPEWLKATGEN